MADVQPRPRGRGSVRGRGGHSSRGGGRPAQRRQNADATSDPTAELSLDEQGELGQMKKQYLTQLPLMKELFPDWTDDDLAFALEETDGDMQVAIERITEGSVSRFADVKKKTREKQKSKAVPETAGVDSEPKSGSSRATRGRGGSDASRSRGRGGTERGRGTVRGARGGSNAAMNGARTAATATAAATTATDTTGVSDAPTTGGWDQPKAGATAAWDDTVPVAAASTAAQTAPKKSSIIPEGTTKSWASMLAKPPPAPAAAAAKSAQAAKGKSDTVKIAEPMTETTLHPEAVPSDGVTRQPIEADDSISNGRSDMSNEAIVTLTPSKDPLTEDNVEHLPDHSIPPTTETVASTRDPRSTVGNVTPSVATPQHSKDSSGVGSAASGHLGSNLRAGFGQGRSSSFQKLKEQHEPVVMPGKHAVNKTAMQFGMMGLGGKPLDVDEDREELETRAQPPQQSPSQPRASLPPASRHAQPMAEPPSTDQMPTPKQAPGLPLPSAAAASQSPRAPGGQPLTHQGYDTHPYGSYGRYGTGAVGPDAGPSAGKAYDPFGSQVPAPGQQDQSAIHPSLSQAPLQGSQPAQAQVGGYSQAPSDYATQYPTEQSRYSNYYGAYGPGGSSMPENIPPQRSTSGFGAADSGYGTGHLASGQQSRFGDSQASGNHTPNPAMSSAQHMGTHSHQHSMHHQGHGHGGYGAGPYSYYNQTYGGYGHQGYPYYGNYGQGYGGGYGSKSSMYGGPPHHNYGVSSQAPYEHSASPANTGGYGMSSQGRDSAMNEYSRSGSTQPSHATAGGGFGGLGDTYGRSGAGYGNQGQGYSQANVSTTDESLKATHDTKNGPSPSLGQSSGRPGSGFAAGAGHPGHQSGYGPPQGQSGGFGGTGYGNQMNTLHGSYSSAYGGGLGGLGGQHGSGQGHQGGGYGGYGSFAGSHNAYGRSGWSGQYGH